MPNTKKIKKVRNIVFDKENKYITLNISNTLLNNLKNIKKIGDNKPELNNNNQSNRPKKPIFTP